MIKNVIILFLAVCLVYSYYHPRQIIDKPIILPAPTSDSIQIGESCQMFEGEFIEFLSAMLPDSRIEDELDTIMKLINLPQHFVLLESDDQENACAFLDKIKSERFIIYNKAFFDSVAEKTKTKWATISILAHEVGHHLSGHTLKLNGSKSSSELEADKFSGYVLGNLGANLEEATSAMKLFGSDIATEGYPSKQDRIAAIDDGWRNAQENIKKNISKEQKSIIPDTFLTIITQREIEIFLRNWLRYQNKNIFEKYADLYSKHFQGIRRALDGKTKYCNQQKWLRARKITYGQATNLNITALGTKVISEDNNGIMIQFKQRWSSDLYQDIGDKVMKIYKNKENNKLYIIYEEMLNCYPF